jgi:lipopolysaccharide biosynthesis glycosyltransferase
MNAQKNAIFISFDDGYAHYAKSCINSIKSNYPAHPEIIINYCGKTKSIIDYISQIENSTLFTYEDKFPFDPGSIGNPIIFNRFNLWTEAFAEYKNILYLDVDVIVLKSLARVFNESDFYVCSDCHEQAKIFSVDDNRLLKSRSINTDDTLKNKLSEDKLNVPTSKLSMVNSGMFLMPPSYRTNTNFNDLLMLAQRYNSHIAYSDQSVISIWCWKNGININSDFNLNCQVRFLCDDSMSINIHDVEVLHFSGEAKSPKEYFAPGSVDLKIYEICNRIRDHYRIVRNNNEPLLLLLNELAEIKQNKPKSP